MANLTRLAVAALLIAPGVAKAAEPPAPPGPPCLTTSEFSSLAGYALPSVIGGTTKRCSMVLGPAAFLKTNGEDLASRYAARKDASWPGAKAAFLKLSAKSDTQANAVFKNLSDESLQEMLDVIIEGMVSQEIPPKECETIDKFARLLAPLPPENTAELVALAASLATDSKPAKVGKLTICPG